MLKHLLFPFLFVLLFYSTTSAQTIKIDSLLSQIPTKEESKAKVDLYLSIASYYLNAKLDSSLAFAQQALVLSKKLDYKEGKIQSLNSLGNYKERKGAYEEALKYYNEGLELSKQNNYTKGLAMTYNNIAIVHTRTADYAKALDLYFEALKAEEQLKNKKGIAESYNNIGVIYYYQQNLDKTLEYLEKSIQIEEELGDFDVLKKGYNNLGALYDYQKNHQKALSYYQKSYYLSLSLNDKAEMSLGLNNIATVFTNLNQLDSSTYYLQRSIALKEELGDYRGIAYSYHNFGANSLAQGKLKEAEDYYNKSLELSLARNLKEVMGETYKNLAGLKQVQKDYPKANEYLHLYIGIKDSLYNEQSTKAIAEMEAKYENEKKQKSILEQQTQIAQQEVEIKQKNLLLISAMAIGVIVVLLFLLVSNHQRQRNLQLEKENQLKDAMAKIELQENLQAQRLRISRDLHDNIGSQLTFIISSIDLLKYGFKLADERLISKLDKISNFTSNTILELRDTIWAMNKAAINFEDMKTRIQNFLTNAKNNSENMEFKFELDSNLKQDYSFSSEEGVHIYRIIQEAVNNAFKYAEASQVSIGISTKNDQLLFVITDNGKGFDTSTISSGFGLMNMQKRATEMNAKLDIKSTLGTGTSVELLV